MSRKIKLTLSEPKVISRAPESVKEWGFWQFPEIEYLSDGRLHAIFHINTDSEVSYGKQKGQAVSSDMGESWVEDFNMTECGGILLDNGDRLRIVHKQSIPIDNLTLPSEISESVSYNSRFKVYDASDFPPELGGWYFARMTKGTTEWVEEQAVVNIPGETRWVRSGVLPIPFLWRMKKAPNGTLWGIHYDFRQGDKCPAHLMRAIFVVSEDNGKTWNFRSEIPYAPDREKDPYWEKRDGFSEPNVAFMPDGSIFCLLRTTDGNGIGPMYWSRSTDGGRTWSDPEVFDNLGVWPAIITLNNGVTLTTYGRPGIYLRATADPSGIEWEDRYEIMAPDASGLTNTCAYTDLIALDDNTAYLIYSDFYYPDDEGKKRKTILGRKITVHI